MYDCVDVLCSSVTWPYIVRLNITSRVGILYHTVNTTVLFLSFIMLRRVGDTCLFLLTSAFLIRIKKDRH